MKQKASAYHPIHWRDCSIPKATGYLCNKDPVALRHLIAEVLLLSRLHIITAKIYMQDIFSKNFKTKK